MISGYGQQGNVDEGMEVFKQMQKEGVQPNEASW